MSATDFSRIGFLIILYAVNLLLLSTQFLGRCCAGQLQVLFVYAARFGRHLACSPPLACRTPYTHVSRPEVSRTLSKYMASTAHADNAVVPFIVDSRKDRE